MTDHGLEQRGEPSLLERPVPELAEHLVCRQVALTQQVSSLGQRVLLLLLAQLSLPPQFIAATQ